MPGSTAKSRYDRRSSRAPPSALPNRADLSRTADTTARRSRSLGARTCASRTTAADRTSFRHRTRSALATLPVKEFMAELMYVISSNGKELLLQHLRCGQPVDVL